jgi:hypothetical protein
MKIRVKAKKAWTPLERTLVKAAFQYASDALELWLSPVPIEIILRGSDDSDYGDCIDLHDRIVVRLNKSDRWLSTLFHELEHARQYIFGELALETETAIWHDMQYTRDPEYYYEEPWEVQARAVEKNLFKDYTKFFLTSLR